MAFFSEYSVQDIFKFERRDITAYMLYKMKLGKKLKTSFKYLVKKLPVQKVVKDLSKLKWDEGKNYDWAIIKDGTVTLIIRAYRYHFTIFFENSSKEDAYFNRYGCFTFHTNTSGMSDADSDMFCDNHFIDLSLYIKSIIKVIAEDKHHGLWNPYSLQLTDNPKEQRPERIEIKNVWNGGEDDLSSVDTFIFCCEEIFGKYLEIFAENDMLDKLKTLAVGDMLNGKYKIINIKTDVKDGYFHNVGLELEGATSKWNDVYSLTRWYYPDIFPE